MKRKKYSALVIDDDSNWLRYFSQLLEIDFEVVTAQNYAEALEEIISHDQPFHIVVTDLRLTEEVSNIDGLRLTELLVKNNKESEIILVTGYPSIETARRAFKFSVRDYFEKSPADRQGFDDVGFYRCALVAAQDIENNRRALLKKKEVVNVDFAIVTALSFEAKAFLRRIDKIRVVRFEDQDIHTYNYGEIPILHSKKSYKIIHLLLPNMGELSAANAVTDTLTRWKPRYLILVGIAGGIPQDDLDLGDVVVANQVICYEYGKVIDTGIKARDRVYPSSSLLLDRINSYWDLGWTEQIGVDRPRQTKRTNPKLFIGPIASGNKVIASTIFRDQLLNRWPKLHAVEMEAEGVFAAAFERPTITHTIVVRGISDMADKHKSNKWQEYAANSAAAFVVGFLSNGPVESKG
jgi:nucleoside phosphorylase/ActR/RegA family two-component response regulator